MKIATGRLFFGCKISTRLREALEQAKPEDRSYFDRGNSAYLQTCLLGEEKWIGKVVDGGLSVGQAEDLQNNVLSILRRIAPGVRHKTDDIRVYTVDQDEPEPPPEPSSD